MNEKKGSIDWKCFHVKVREILIHQRSAYLNLIIKYIKAIPKTAATEAAEAAEVDAAEAAAVNAPEDDESSDAEEEDDADALDAPEDAVDAPIVETDSEETESEAESEAEPEAEPEAESEETESEAESEAEPEAEPEAEQEQETLPPPIINGANVRAFVRQETTRWKPDVREAIDMIFPILFEAKGCVNQTTSNPTPELHAMAQQFIATSNKWIEDWGNLKQEMFKQEM